MRREGWKQGPLVALAALVLGVLIAQIAVARSGSNADSGDIARLERDNASLHRQINSLKADVGAATAAKKKSKRGPRGPAGPQGPAGAPGTQGPAGPQGSSGASMLVGFVPSANMPVAGGTDNDFVPVGEATTIDRSALSPNSTVVLRDLSVRVDAAPGFGTEWEISVGRAGGARLSCQISGTFGVACNSGSQTATVEPGSIIDLRVLNSGGAAPSALAYGYRAVTP